MSVADYLATKRQISAQYLAQQVACGTASSNTRELCLVEALGRDRVAKADLEVAYRSTPRTRFEASEARAEARFWFTREQCRDVAERNRTGCVRDAKAVQLGARADGAALMKVEEQEAALDDACADEAAKIGQRHSHACVLRAADASKRQGRSQR